MGLYESGAWSGSTLAAAVAFKGAYSTTMAWTHAAISSGQFGEILIASTTADINPGDLFQVTQVALAPVSIAGFRMSTVATSRVTVVLAVPGSSASSTLSGTLRVSWIDLT